MMRPVLSGGRPTHSVGTCFTTMAGGDSGAPRLPGLDSGMTRGKWRREGLRGLWKKRQCNVSRRLGSAGPRAGAGLCLPPSAPCRACGRPWSQALHQLRVRTALQGPQAPPGREAQRP